MESRGGVWFDQGDVSKGVSLPPTQADARGAERWLKEGVGVQGFEEVLVRGGDDQFQFRAPGPSRKRERDGACGGSIEWGGELVDEDGLVERCPRERERQEQSMAFALGEFEGSACQERGVGEPGV